MKIEKIVDLVKLVSKEYSCCFESVFSDIVEQEHELFKKNYCCSCSKNNSYFLLSTGIISDKYKKL